MVGVLALQGAFREHIEALNTLGAEAKEIRKLSDLANLDGIILPGGESTVQGKLLRELDMLNPLRDMILSGLPVLATCAGLILLSKTIENDENRYLATLPVTVKRNAYGRQLGSFITNGKVGDFNNFEMVFIRAPYITEVDNSVDLLSKYDYKITGVRYKNQIALSFHPELSNDTRLHKLFLSITK